MIMHSRIYHSGLASNDIHIALGDAAVSMGAFPDKPDEWQKIIATIRLRAPASRLDW